MPDRDLGPIFDALRVSDAGVPDGELLRRFATSRDPAAFELIVWRHAAMVRAVCRRVTRDAGSADDAFQATFLVLLRKASTVRIGDALAGWLHRVALRAAVRAKRPRPAESGDLDALPAAEPVEPDADLLRAVHEEIDRLPARYRAVVASCFLEGHTHERAAALLGCPVGTVAGRMARAKELLRRRLSSRGIDEAALAAVVPGAGPVAAAVAGVMKWLGPASRTAPEAIRVLRLAEGVMSATWTSQLKMVAAVALVFGAMGVTAGMALSRVGGSGERDTPAVAAAREEPREKKVEVDPVVIKVTIRRNMTAISAAINAYESAKGHFPLPAIADDDGKPLLSWRVAILPYLGQKGLYEKFKLDEAWDGPNNVKLLAEMPAEFAIPGVKAGPGETYLQYVVGPGALFPRHELTKDEVAAGKRLAENVRRGTVDMFGRGGEGRGMFFSSRYLTNNPRGPRRSSYPAVLAESASAVAWTAPRDVAFDGKTPPALGVTPPEAFHLLPAGDHSFDHRTRTPVMLPREAAKPFLVKILTGEADRDIPWGTLTTAAEGGGASARRDALVKLSDRNAELKRELDSLKVLTAELKKEARNLGWQIEAEAQAKRDEDTAQLIEANAKLEAEMKAARKDADALLEELRRLRKAAEKK